MQQKLKWALSVAVLATGLGSQTASASWRPSLPSRPHLPSVPSLPTLPTLPRPPQIHLPDPRSWTEVSNNVEEQRQNLRREYRAVILGKHINHAEYLRFGSAIAASVATENPGPVLTYLQAVVAETKAELMRNGNSEAQRVARNFTKEMLARLLDSAYRGNRPQLYQFHGVKVKVGFVTYAYWKKIVTEYPYVSNGQIKWRKDENRVTLPNTHQIYVGIDF